MKVNVYDFCMSFYKAGEIRLHLWKDDETGREVCEHITLNDKYGDDGIKLYSYKDYEVIQFSVPKRNTIDIIASNFDM